MDSFGFEDIDYQVEFVDLKVFKVCQATAFDPDSVCSYEISLEEEQQQTDSTTDMLRYLILRLRSALVSELHSLPPITFQQRLQLERLLKWNPLDCLVNSILASDAHTRDLLRQLPDWEQQIYIQLDQLLSLDTFHHFKKLPIELRIKVFHLAFPESHSINLDTEFVLKSHPDFKTRKYIESRRKLFPITLFINSESRKETLKYYCVYSWRDHLYGARSKDAVGYPPLCFNPEVDQLYLTRHTLTDIEDFDWSRSLKLHHGDMIKSITSLTIREWPMLHPLQYEIPKMRGHTVKTLIDILAWEFRPVRYVVSLYSITRFSGLKHLAFVVRKGEKASIGNTKYWNWLSSSLDNCFVDVLEEYFGQFSSSFGGEIPKISIEEWQPLPK